MNAAQLFVMLSVAFAPQLQAAEFNIEDADLTPVSVEAVRIIRDSLTAPEDFAECRIVGRRVDLDGDGKRTDWVATTANGCNWGAATASIWVLRKDAAGYRLVLSYGGADLTVGKAKLNGLRHIAISSGTAGHYGEVLLKFNGSKYIEARSRFVDLSNPEDCRKNRDVCNYEKP